MLNALERELLASIVDSSDDGIVGKTLDGIITSWNRSAARIFGYSADEAVGRHISLLFPPERLAEEVHFISEIVAGRRVEHFQTERVRKDGERIAVSVTLSPIRDASGTIIGVSKIVRDMSERQRLERRAQETSDVLSLAMHGGRMGAWSRNLATDHVWWSRELESLFGLEEGAFASSTEGFRALVHEANLPEVEAAVAAAIQSRTDYVIEFRFRHASGEWRWMEGRGRAVYRDDGTPQTLYGVGIDITSRREFEHALMMARKAADADAERLNLALDAARLGDWSWHAGTDVVTFSARAAEIFGIPPGPFMTWTDLRDLLHADDRERARLAVEEAIATHSGYGIEYRLINGARERWVSVSGRARYDESGQVLGMFGVVQEITADRLLVHVDDAIRPVVDPDVIIYTAAGLLGEHLRVNRCAYALVDKDQDNFTLAGNYTAGTHSIVGRYAFHQFGRECLRLMRAGIPFIVADADNDPRIDADVLPAYRATDIRAVICVPILKSGRFVAAMAVHASTPRFWDAREVELVQQVASRCWESIERSRIEREREGLLEAAEGANRAKDEFLAMLGHELRNPLSPILTALQLMKLRGDASSDRERTIIERQVKHLTRLVDDLLDVSRIARGKVELKPQVVEMGDIISAAVEVASPLLQQRGQALTIQVPRPGLTVHGDAARLSQVMSNLLTNAAKYTPAGGAIQVTAGHEADEVVVVVRDTGIGISADVLPRLFDLFVQGAQAIDRAEGGLGLGLSIVRSLVEAHGGSVEGRSDGPGKGSTFTVRLPAVRVLAEAPVESPSRPRLQSAGALLLIVDDNEDSASLLAEALRMMGHEAYVAHDGVEALRLGATLPFEAAFLDIGLPVMDGFELAVRLKATPGLEEISLVAVTGYGQDSDRRRTAAAGFRHHLVKPVDLETLDTLIDSLRRPRADVR